MKRTKRILSAVLSAALTFSTVGVQPVLAAPTDLFSLELDGKYLVEGASKKLYLDSLEGGKDLAIQSVAYSDATGKVTVDEKTGNISIAPGTEITDGEKVTLNATVTYYNPEDVIFYDNFEGEKKFTEAAPASYKHSAVKSHWGRTAGTPVSGVTGPATHTISSEMNTVGSVTVWFYDTAEKKVSGDQAKLAFEVNKRGISGNHAVGVVFDTTMIENNVGSNEKYVYRDGKSAPNYGWFITDVVRTEGWHKLQWDVTETGATASIDGTKVYENAALTSIGWVSMMTNWNVNNPENIDEKMFFDDVIVVKPNARTETTTVSKEITLRKQVDYSLEGETEVRFDKDAAPKPEVSITMAPNVDPKLEITLNGTSLTNGVEYTVAGNKISFDKNYIADLPCGTHEFLLHVLDRTLTFKVIVFSTVGREYYFSNVTGNDTYDGSREHPWKTLDKLNSMTLQPGDTVYLDAKSTWEGQIILDDSGLDGMPITITKYNADSRDERPVINAGSFFVKQADIRKPKILTLANQGANCYAAGAIEVLNASYINISGLEITNHGGEADKARLIGRNGILVIADLPDSTTNASYMTEWNKAKQTDIHISDCYVHDVNSAAAYKLSGGINFMGNIDNIVVENCTAINCDVEGIRNAGLYNRNSAWPAVHHVTFKNNYIERSTGDGMVISNVLDSTISGNVVTQCGKPELSGTANYAALWLCGSDGAVVEHNEVFNNPYITADDGEAFDFDHGTKNSVYQYNYSHDNYGGTILFMNSMGGRNMFRYNISVDDGGDPHNPHVLFHNAVNGKAPYIYNNVFVLAPEAKWLYGQNNNGTEVHFINNIVMSLNGNLPGFSKAELKTGEIKNNIFWPQELYDKAQEKFGTATAESNFAADPLLASAGSKPEGIIMNPGTAEAKFDAEKLVAYKLLENSPAIDKGIVVDLTGTGIEPEIAALDQDLFGNAISGTPDIGVHEWSNDSPVISLPKSVEVTADTTELLVGETVELQATVLPETADQTIRWETSDKEVATVDANGVVTAKGLGTVTITAVSVADASVKGSIEIKVTKFGPGVLYGFKVCAEDSFVVAGDRVQLSVEGIDRFGDPVEVAPENIVEVIYTTDEGTVDENGVLTVPEDAVKQEVSIHAQVKMKSDEYVETFETGSTLTGGNLSLERVENFGHDDDYSMKTVNCSTADNDASQIFEAPRQGTVSLWFYDYDPAVTSVRKSISVSPNTTLHAIGVHWDGASGSPENYVYRTGDTTWHDSGMKREEGWHEFKWDFSDEGLKLFIDSELVGENPNVFNYKRIDILSRKGWSNGGNTGFYIDEICAYQDEQYETESISLDIIAEGEFYTEYIKVVEDPDKMVYNIGETFEPEGMRVVAVQKASPSNATPANADSIDEDPIDADIIDADIIDEDLIDADPIDATPANADSIDVTPANADRDGITREVELDLSDLEFENDVFEEAGKATVTVVYTEVNGNLEERRFTAPVHVTVNEDGMPEDEYYTLSIKKTKNPDKMSYKVGDSFDPEGMVITVHQKATPSNAEREEVVPNDELTFKPETFTKSGRQKVTVIYDGLDKNLEEKRFTLTFTVNVQGSSVPSTGGGSSSSSAGPASVRGTWKQNATGWWFAYENGGYPVNKWEKVNGSWYYFNEAGYMATGWNNINGSWYYLDSVTGAMKTGWYQESQDGFWYYLDPVTGAMKTGWIHLNSGSYYLNETPLEPSWSFNAETGSWSYAKKGVRPHGAMYQNEVTPDGEKVDSNGAKVK